MKVQSLAVGVLAAGLAVAVAGCSGGSTSSGPGSGASSTGSGASTGTGSGAGSGSSASSGSGSGSGSSASGGSAGQLTGTQLTKLLLPASDFPHSFAVSQQGSADSGSSLEKAAASYNLSTLSCSDWDNYFTGSGFGETAYASGSVASSAKDQSYGQVVYQFAGKSAASAFFSGVQSLSDRCHSFNASGGGAAHVTMRLASASSVAGHQTFSISQATTIVGTSSKIDTLFALDGTDVIAISASGVGYAPPSSPAPAALLQELISKLKTHQ